MRKPNTTDAPTSDKGVRNLFLLVVHVVVLMLTVWAHPPSLSHAGRALPQVTPVGSQVQAL